MYIWMTIEAMKIDEISLNMKSESGQKREGEEKEER